MPSFRIKTQPLIEAEIATQECKVQRRSSWGDTFQIALPGDVILNDGGNKVVVRGRTFLACYEPVDEEGRNFCQQVLDLLAKPDLVITR